MKKLSTSFFTLLLLVGFSISAFAQKAIEPRPSPMALVKANLGDTYVSIIYSQPHKKGRVIFGDLVPFGKVWRFGANDATQLTTTGDIMLGDKTLKAGTYTIFCTPEKDAWTISFNSALGQWGAFQYDAAKDVLKISAKTVASPETYEAFTLKFDKPEGKSTVLSAMWDGTMISIPVKAL